MNSNTLKVRLRMRVYRGSTIAIGPGKIAVLQAIDQTGSITGAAKYLGMSYRRTWLLVDEINQSLVEPATLSAEGGYCGGGTRLTTVGRQIIHHYQAAEEKALRSAQKEIDALMAMMKT